MRIYLEKNRSSFSNNVEGVVNTTLSTKNRLLPNNDVSDVFSLLEQYNKERDECRKFRLIFNINPICSNVLFNTKTEIVINEGSEGADCLFMGKEWRKDEVAKDATNSINNINYVDAIRNTEYTHSKLGKFVYHCGLDIFNNHMLRNKGFVHVNKTNDDKEVYNTIEDTMRYADGTVVEQDIAPSNGGIVSKMHLYTYDKILSFKKAFSERCEEKNGWWGFINPGYINIPNRTNENILTNLMMANNKPCEFIDLYPDRSLFLFNPLYNKYRKRVEKNWDYCITYPYKNDYDIVNNICGVENNSIKAKCERLHNTNGIEIVQCESYFNHNLKIGDYITLYYEDDMGLQTFNKKIKVVRIGDLTGNNENKIFAINYSDIQSIYHYILNKNYLHFKKNINGVECVYYARIYKKIGILDSEINKVAFGTNIYGDATSQIIFTDDVNIEGLLDNNGRPLSEIYLTIVKRNKGYNIWYNKNGNLGDEKIEYSHCFGKITSGIEYSGMRDEPDLYNIHKMHNVYSDNVTPSILNTVKAWGDSVGYVDKSDLVTFKRIDTLEDDITVDMTEFLGDIVEYDFINAIETTISPIYHRFNTVQRELFDERFRDVLHDSIVADDYDAVVEGTENEFKVKTYFLNDIERNNNEYIGNGAIANEIDSLFYGNISPEGYYYNPHYKVKLIEESNNVSTSNAKLVNYFLNDFEIDTTINEIKITVPTNFGFYKGDFIAFYNENDKTTLWGEITTVVENRLTLIIHSDNILNLEDFIKSGKKITKAYWSLDNVPTYAKLEPKSRKFIWRKLVNQSKLKPNDSLYETPFSNGRLYIEKNINFFLRRQDPNGKYGLSEPIYKENMVFNNPMKKFIIKGYEPYDFSLNEFKISNFDNCY